MRGQHSCIFYHVLKGHTFASFLKRPEDEAKSRDPHGIDCLPLIKRSSSYSRDHAHAAPLGAKRLAWIILRGRICACVVVIGLGFVTMPRVLHVRA